MRAVWLQPDPSYLEERQRLGLDRRDEVWDGVLHMVPPPVSRHEDLVTSLLIGLSAICRPRGLVVSMGGLFGSDKNYRCPDVLVGRPAQRSERGFEGAELVIEVLSPNDESRDKFPFFAKLGVREVWLIEPKSRELELYELRDGRYVRHQPLTVSPVLGVTLDQREGQLVIGGAVI